MFILCFKQLVVEDIAYDLHTIQYTYDALSRLLEADYDSGTTVYTYGYDRAGNLVDMDGATRTYNAANQLVNDGTNTLAYDANGNLTNDGTNAHTWDRANRLISMGGYSYAYDGLNNRVSQTVSSVVTNYLLDVQPGLVNVLAQTIGADTTRYVYSPRGIHAQETPAGAIQHIVTDGLHSVRSVVDDTLSVLEMTNYVPYGVPDSPLTVTDWAFTGEMRNGSGLQYHRARYYNPGIGLFPSLDPLEGVIQRPMSLNGYSWVEGNPVTHTDPSGMLFWSFPPGTGSRRRTLYDVDQYGSNRNYGHAWIERWLEEENGFWETHLEFPGSGRRIDAIVLEQTASPMNPSPLYFTAPIGGNVFEIEPANVTAIAVGYGEVLLKTGFLIAGDGSPYCLGNHCRLPGRDRWNPERPMMWSANPYVNSYSRAPYDLRQVQWQLGDRLSPRAINDGRGPERVDPNSLGAAGIPEAYWILLPVPGLIVYETESNLRDLGIVLSVAAIGRYLMDQYNRAQQSNPQQLPVPVPLPAYSTSTQSSGISGETLVIGGIVIVGLCIAAFTPIPDEWLILGLAGAG